MKTTGRYILMLEDDSDDRHLTETFFAENNYDIRLEFLTEAKDVMPYLENLRSTGMPLPSLILIDKYVQVKGGIETLKAIKAHPVFAQVPVVVISGSDLPGDIAESYRLGANSYIVKPAYSALTARKIATFVTYWFEVAELPVVRVAGESGGGVRRAAT